MRRSITKINAQVGVELWSSVAEELNDIIRATGQLQKDNPLIWGGILHKWDNMDWAVVCDAMFTVLESNPQYFKSFHENSLLTAELVLLAKHQQSHRIMDTKRHKGDAWRLLMTMREVYNAISDINLPNDDKSIEKRKSPSLLAFE
jgi:hypothetical protein